MRYPEIARSSGIEGKVTVKVLVGPDGSVVQSVDSADLMYSEMKYRQK